MTTAVKPEWLEHHTLRGLFIENLLGREGLEWDVEGGWLQHDAYWRSPWSQELVSGIGLVIVDGHHVWSYPWVPKPEDAPSTCYNCGGALDQGGTSTHIYCFEGTCWCPCWLCGGVENADPEGGTLFDEYYSLACHELRDLIGDEWPQHRMPPLPGMEPTSTFGFLFQAFLYG